MSRAKYHTLKHSEALYLLGRTAGKGLLSDFLKADIVPDGDLTIGDGGITVVRRRTEQEVTP